MKIVNLSNIFHHLQKPLADELYKLTDGNFWFVETDSMQNGMAYKGEKAEYVIQYNEQNRERVQQIVNDADAVLFGEAPIHIIKERYKARKLTFRDDERRYKKVNRYLKWPVYTYHSLLFNKGYLLCASAYGARDYYYSGMAKEKCFKWGYFPSIKKYDDVDGLIDSKSYKRKGVVQIFWVGRLVSLKHPESVIRLASILKQNDYKFQIKVAGDGPEKEHLQSEIKKNKLENDVFLLGKQGPEDVRSLMEESDVYLFTSDRSEGWGAVLNESMNSACAVVSSPAPGAAPFLIKDKHNALFFKDRDWDDMAQKVMWLIDHPEERAELGRNAYETMLNIWSPEVAARNFLTLVKALQEGSDPDIKEGPCSRAEYLPQNWR